jgi:gamma-glutamylputrescine oxidase
LAAAAQAAGVIIHEHSPAQRIITGERCVVQTPGGQVRCRFLVLTGGAYMDELVPELRRKIMPVGTYITATEPLGEERARRLLPHNAAVTDTNFVLDYFRRTADHRLLFGGRVSYSTFQPPRLAAILRQRMLQVFPPLADVRQAYTWGGFVDITINRFPHFGRIAPNAFFAHGFSGHGIALTGLAGKLLAEAVAGQAERFDLFAKVRHRDFPGGKAMRMPLLVIAMTWFRLRDLL